MPWNGAGTFNPDPAYFPESNGDVIDAVRYDGTVTDVAGGITNCLAKDGQNSAVADISMGGYKLTNLAAAITAGDAVRFEQNYLRGSASIASAATTSIFATPETFITVTGATGITSFGTGTAGDFKFVTFQGVLTITNSGSLQVRGGSNYTTAFGDTALVQSLGGTSAYVLQVFKNAGGVIGLGALPDGTVSLPSLTFSSGSSNGLYWVGTNSWGMAAAGVQRFAVNATTWGITYTTGSVVLGISSAGNTTVSSGTNSTSVLISGGSEARVSTLTGGGDVLVTPSPSAGSASTPGNLNLRGADMAALATANAGAVYIRGGIAQSNANGGQVYIAAGLRSGSGAEGRVNFCQHTTANTYTPTWYIDQNGLPIQIDGRFEPTLNAGWGTGATIEGSAKGFRITFGTTPSTTATLNWPAGLTGDIIATLSYVGTSFIQARFTNTAHGTIVFSTAPTAGEWLDVITEFVD